MYKLIIDLITLLGFIVVVISASYLEAFPVILLGTIFLISLSTTLNIVFNEVRNKHERK